MAHTPRKWLTLLVALCVAAYLITYAVINILGFPLFADADMYTDTLVARLMWEQKTLFPNGWIFGNQFYIASTPVLAALFYGLVSNTNTAMILATCCMGFFLILSFSYCVRSFAKGILPCLIGLLALMAAIFAPDFPRTPCAQLLFLQASYYSCYLITFFVVVGDYARAFQSSQLRLAPWLFSCTLSFAMGMQSLRQTVAMALPIVAYEGFLALRRLVQKQPLFTFPERRTLLRGLSYLAANLLGRLAISLLAPSSSSIYGSTAIAPPVSWLDRLGRIWPCFSSISGLKYCCGPEFSPVLALISIFFAGVVFLAILCQLGSIRKKETPLVVCWSVCLIGLAATALSTVVTQVQLRDIYLFLWYPLVTLSFFVLLEKIPMKGLLIALLCLASTGTLLHGYTFGAEQALQNSPTKFGRAYRLAKDYGYQSYTYLDEQSRSAQALCHWAMEQGYTFVYGSWFDAPSIALHSGGKLTSGHWWIEDPYVPLLQLNLQNIYGPEENAKAIYVFTPGNEETCLNLAQERGIQLTKAAEFGQYSAYTASAPLLHPRDSDH